MNDLARAKANLAGHSICLCKGDICITDDSRGIAPMMQLLAKGTDLRGFSCADLIVGKAAAMLFVKAGLAAVHGNVMSEQGKAYLESHGIFCTCDTLTPRIINRQGTGICPMEQTVADIGDAEAGYAALRERLAKMRAAHAENVEKSGEIS